MRRRIRILISNLILFGPFNNGKTLQRTQYTNIKQGSRIWRTFSDPELTQNNFLRTRMLNLFATKIPYFNVLRQKFHILNVSRQKENEERKRGERKRKRKEKRKEKEEGERGRRKRKEKEEGSHAFFAVE